MTTFDFSPTTTAAFQFQPTFDGAVYNVIIPWSLFGRRYYVACYSLDGNLVFLVPLTGSPTGVAVQALEWKRGNVIVTSATPHGFKPGQTTEITISGCVPPAYNGKFKVLAVDPVTLSYPLASNPGQATTLGHADQNESLTAGYFDSTLVYRTANRQFEVSP